VPQAAGVFFDDLLRRILEGPTVAGLAASLVRARPEEARSEEASSPLVVIDERGEGLPVLLVHGSDGTLGALRDLVGALGGRVPLLGLVVGDVQGYLAVEPDVLVQRTAAAAARSLLDRGCSRMHVLGHGFGAVLACEVARHLADAGGEVETMTVIGEPEPAEKTGDPVTAHSVAAAAAHEPEAYPGDLTLVRLLSEGNATVEHWRAVCLGDLHVIEVPDLAALADVVGTALRELRGTP
jgi:pimeloyl-ACP methyl ester carboxylesterase